MFQSSKIIQFHTFSLAKNLTKLVHETNPSTIFLVIQQQKYHSFNRGNAFKTTLISSRNLFENQKFTKTTVALPSELDKKLDLPVIEKQSTDKKTKLPENIRFTPCPTVNDGTVDSVRPLVLLFGWMLCEEKVLDKFRKFWFERGCDVLSVRTSPLDLLLPHFGGRRNAEIMVKFLYEKRPSYDEIVVHAFSVGGYQYGEVQNILETAEDEETKRIITTIKGLILDSVVFSVDCAPGLSRAITLNPVLQPILQKSIELFLAILSPVRKRYKLVEDCLVYNKPRRPGLVMYSSKDVVSSDSENIRIDKIWTQQGIHSEMYHTDDSPHVLLYKNNPDGYTKAVDTWLSNINTRKIGKKT